MCVGDEIVFGFGVAKLRECDDVSSKNTVKKAEMCRPFAAVAVHLSCKRLPVRHRASWSRVGDRFDVRHYSSCFVAYQHSL